MMAMSRWLYAVMTLLVSTSVFSREIVVGIERVPTRQFAVLFTPVVLPDLISAKAAFEYRLHDKFNLVIPFEAKWMDYRQAIRLLGGSSDYPQGFYDPDNSVRPVWNFDFSQLKLSMGVGLKWFPFSESMTNAFFVKTAMLAGIERFKAYSAEKKKGSAVFTHVVTVGYNWVKRNGFTFGVEVGEEYTWHTSPIRNLPMLIKGFMPLAHFSLGFTI